MPSDSPLVCDASLLLPDHPDAASIDVGSDAWWSWLERPGAETFRYAGAAPFTARREARAGGHYWYAHRRVNGRLAKVYLGRSRELSQEVLEAAALKLADRRPPTPAPAPAPAAPAAPTAPVAREELAAHLPAQPTRLIGRERELSIAADLLRRGGVRLLTLLGPGGTGKSRLAVALGESLREAYADGVSFVDLVPATDAEAVLLAIGQALGVAEAAHRSPLQVLQKALADRQCLLLLDNFEHVLDAAPLISRLLAACPGLAVVATSREPLRVAWEQVAFVPPLELPESDQPIDAATALRSAAVALFVERSQAIAPTFRLTDDNAREAAEICAHLDGLPLAIELAAARSNLLPPRSMLGRLSRRLDFLRGGRDRPERHQTLRAAIAGSYDVLDEPAQHLFRCLGVFETSFSFEAAEAVAAMPDDSDPLEALASLVDKSLVQREAQQEPRFRLLQTIREYALEQAEASGDLAPARRRMAAHYLDVAETAAPSLTGPEQATYVDHLDREHDNMRAVLRWATSDGGDLEVALRLGAALWRFWSIRGHFTEGQQWLERALARSEQLDARWRAPALFGAAQMLARRGLLDAAQARCEAAAQLFDELEDAAGIAGCVNTLGNIAFDAGEYSQARAYYERGLSLRRVQADVRGVAVALHNLGGVAYCQQDYIRAERLYEEGLALRRQVGDAAGIARGLVQLAYTARARGHYARAAQLAREGLSRCRELGDRWSYAECFELLAEVAVADRDPERACRLLGAEEALREQMAVPLPPAERDTHERVLASVRGRLGPELFDALWREGREVPLEDSINFALARRGAERPEPVQLVADRVEADPLTSREREIAALIARGLSNREIGDELVIAEGTAARHVANILSKLNFSSRAQVAAWFVEESRPATATIGRTLAATIAGLTGSHAPALATAAAR